MTFTMAGYRALELLDIRGPVELYRGERLTGRVPVLIKSVPAGAEPVLDREAALLAAADHPHLLPLLDVADGADRSVLVFSFPGGGNLFELVRQRGPLTAGQTVTVLLPIAAALAAVHARGQIHGDLTAERILLDDVGRPLLADLGAAAAAAEFGYLLPVCAGDAAPEVARGGSPTAATDLFGLGSVALTCLIGRPAWPADDLHDVLVQSTAGQWPDPGTAAGTGPLAAVVRALLDSDPGRRPPAGEVVRQLDGAGSAEPLADPAGRAGSGERAGPADRAAQTADRPGPTAGADAAARFGGSVGATLVPAIGRRRGSGRHATSAPDRRGSSHPDGETARHRRRAAAGTASGVPRAGWGRLALAGLAVAAVLGVAVQAGLWWARAGRHDPVVATVAAANPAPVAVSGTGQAIGTSPVATRFRLGSAAARPAAPASSSPATVAARAEPERPTAAGTPGPAVATAAEGSTDWLRVVRSLDAARNRALTDLDPARLAAAYVPTSPARVADLALIRQLRERGWRVSGGTHTIERAVLVGSGSQYRVRVNDTMSRYRVVDGAGEVVGSAAGRGSGQRVLVLVRTPAGYRIDRIDDS